MTQIRKTRRGDCTVLTLARPQVRNAISNSMLDEFQAHLEDIAAGDSRAVVITGEGKGFCAGTDLREMTDMGVERYLERVDRVHRLFLYLRDYPLISVAAVNGAALGGGTELAAACTFRVAAAGAIFGLPEVRLGVIPSYGGTQLVSRLIGENRALELMLSARQVGGEEALTLGLVNRLCGEGEDVVSVACDFAAQMGRFGLVAQRSIRACAAFDGSLEEGMALERRHSRRVFASEDAREGVAAFLAKREPGFVDN